MKIKNHRDSPAAKVQSALINHNGFYGNAIIKII
jgi:hypothetical protein